MSQRRFELIQGVVSGLQVRQDEQDFVFSDSDKAAGSMAAVGLGLGGLAGAATGAALSSSDTADKVDFFACKVGDRLVLGRFGQVTFVDGNVVEVVGLSRGMNFEAYALTRPSDQTIWLYPHCGRGTAAYKRFCGIWIPAVSFGVLGCLVLLFNSFVADQPASLGFLALLILSNGLICSLVFLFVAARFFKFSRLSSELFTALGFDRPSEVDLHKRLREAGKTLSNTERLNYHPHARWVYKY